MPTAPAIASAIYNAVSVRIRHLPITAEKIFKPQYIAILVRSAGFSPFRKR